jgi:hypothetical protein
MPKTSIEFLILYKKLAKKCVTKPQKIFVNTGIFIIKTIGLYKNETSIPIQKELQSGHNIGTRTYGIFATNFLTGAKILA